MNGFSELSKPQIFLKTPRTVDKELEARASDSKNDDFCILESYTSEIKDFKNIESKEENDLTNVGENDKTRDELFHVTNNQRELKVDPFLSPAKMDTHAHTLMRRRTFLQNKFYQILALIVKLLAMNVFLVILGYSYYLSEQKQRFIIVFPLNLVAGLFNQIITVIVYCFVSIILLLISILVLFKYDRFVFKSSFIFLSRHQSGNLLCFNKYSNT